MARKKASSSRPTPASAAPPHHVVPPMIEVRGATQNNLKGIDLDLPLGQLNVITGPSGSGKSSLAFQTLYAEGQRRYVETFSPYVRQFFDRMDKPQVESIRGIPPAIAIEQNNAVKTTRSTVGTITEINDYLKLLFPRLCQGFDPKTGEIIEPDTAESVQRKAHARWGDRALLITFGLPVPAGAKPAEFFDFLRGEGYLRTWIYGQAFRTDEANAYPRGTFPARVDVIQDRVSPARKSRFLEAVERALTLGHDEVTLIEPDSGERQAFARGWRSAATGTDLRPPTPGLFSFNHPLGACPVCRGFGRVIGLDLDRALPDKSLSIAQGVVKAFQGDTNMQCQRDLLKHARIRMVDVKVPFDDLPEEEQRWVLYGDHPGDTDKAWENDGWYGVKGFFDWMETRTYKMHVRVFLSRFRSYTTCAACNGGRLQPEALAYRVGGKTLPELWQLPVERLAPFIASLTLPRGDDTVAMLHGEILGRLHYLEQVGLGYLDLDRPTRTLSGGETERVSLTTCLGSSLTNTLFVLDEPTVGLHPRDTGRLIGIMERLRDHGNTLVVVEHEESVIRAADHLVDIGPGRGEGGGELVFAGPPAQLFGKSGTTPRSLTAAYLRGDRIIPVPEARRPAAGWLTIRRAAQHNLKKIDVRVPLGLFCCVSGVSGSGKSTLVHSVLYENLLRRFGGSSENEPGRCREIEGAGAITEVVMVDQSPLSRTPRSTPAVYIGIFEPIRVLFTRTPEGLARDLKPGYFSFNSGPGRCARCSGNGLEKVEMQFLSDIYVTCPECEGTRYTKEALEIQLRGKTIHEVLSMTVSEALEFFFAIGGAQAGQAVAGLRELAEVGLGYLRLGQPLNTLSGGESQRLKLVGRLVEQRHAGDTEPAANRKGKGPLLIFDEPTTGLHFDDVAMLLKMFDRLVRTGHSVLVIEHNTEVIKCADWVIDLGPEAGTHGGEVVAAGTPEQVAAVAASHTGRFLAEALDPPGKRALRAAETPTPFKVSRSAAIGARGIVLEGAREHNLKDISLEIPRDQFVVITGLSGSGKSTLAFDIVFAEGQRRFLDSMSTYARQFVEQMERPDIDRIGGLPPTVAIEQRISRGGGKSTVATVTEVYHFLRLLFAKTGVQHSPDTGKPVVKQSVTAILARIQAAAKRGTVTVLAPVIKARKGFHTEVAEWAGRQGFSRLLVDGKFQAVEGFTKLARFKEHTIDVVVGEVTKQTSGTEARDILEKALAIGKQTAKYLGSDGELATASTIMSDPDTGRSFEELDPRLFSYNSPHGCCPECRGYGTVVRGAFHNKVEHGESVLESELREERRRAAAEEESLDGESVLETVTCPACQGARLNEVARHVRVHGNGIHEIASRPVHEARGIIDGFKFTGTEAIIARDILPEISQRLRFLEEVGLGYLQLDRSATTLSGGESQRIRLAAQLGSNLRGVLYVLDEPTIGLHPRDNARLLDTLVALRDKGNSLLVVEHDEDTMRRADHIIDLGPGAGRFGGQVSAQGSWAEIMAHPESATARALNEKITHPMTGTRRPLPALESADDWIIVTGARANNLKDLTIHIPVARLTGISGVSGSGKSTLMRGVLKPAVTGALSRRKKSSSDPVPNAWKTISGLGRIEAVYEVDQSPIGKTSRSTPATYVKVFDDIRALFAQLPEARARGYTASRFSFNTEGGRCETCKGNGQIKLEMSFLPTSHLPCEECDGLRYNAATLEVAYRGKSIGEVMRLTIDEAADFFEGHPRIHRTLALLRDTGLGYLQIGQPSPTLSGGESQRLKLVTELTRGQGRAINERIRKGRAAKSNLYLIEEPTIGLHLSDVRRLIDVLHRLVDEGHTVVVIEHHLDILAEADYQIDIGPEAGEEGGTLVASGTPEEIAACPHSRTAPFLRDKLTAANGRAAVKKKKAPPKKTPLERKR